MQRAWDFFGLGLSPEEQPWTEYCSKAVLLLSCVFSRQKMTINWEPFRLLKCAVVFPVASPERTLSWALVSFTRLCHGVIFVCFTTCYLWMLSLCKCLVTYTFIVTLKMLKVDDIWNGEEDKNVKSEFQNSACGV